MQSPVQLGTQSLPASGTLAIFVLQIMAVLQTPLDFDLGLGEFMEFLA
jgi:hypothetical protein